MSDLYTTSELIGALDAMDRPVAFMRDKYFSRIVESDAEEIAIDKMLRRRNMAPFVSPDVPAKDRKKRGRSVETFSPASVKPLNTVRPSDLLKRAHGEKIGERLTPGERKPALINQILLDQDDEITRREEWMAAQILQKGEVKIEGEDYPTVIMDFNRPAAHTKALTSSARWGESGVSIKDNITAWATLVQKSSGGVVADIVLGAEAAQLFQSDDEIKELLNNRKQVDTDGFRLMPVAAGSNDHPAAYLGSIGQYDFVTYTQFFTDDAGNEIEVWPSYGCGVISRGGLAGNMAYGAILDLDSLVPTSRFPTNFNEKNPSREVVMTQSRPLPVPSDVSGSLFTLVR